MVKVVIIGTIGLDNIKTPFGEVKRHGLERLQGVCLRCERGVERRERFR